MSKLLNIAWKDLWVTFRDPGALIMMLATPFVLTLVIAFAFGGGSSSGSSVLQHVPVVVVNHDSGSLGGALLDTLRSPNLADLLSATMLTDDAEARGQVDAGRAVAAVIIPSDFSNSIMPSGGGVSTGGSVVETYADPTRPVSAGVVRGVVGSVVSQFVAGSVAGQVAVQQLVANGLIPPQDALARGEEIGKRAAQSTRGRLVGVRSETATGASGGGSPGGTGGFDWLAYMAPSMAILFLMFTVTAGGRTILAEREAGTLSRMLVTPTRSGQVVGGKVFGIFVVGLVQMVILIMASVLLFRIQWGSATGVAALTLALVAAATGWGALLAAYCRTPAQAGQFGSMLALVFAILAGNLVPRQILPEWLRTASYITPNAWGLEGYTRLAAGGGPADIALIVVALLVMAAVLFGGATLLFKRQYA